MSQSASERVRWIVADLDLLPDNGTRYEIIDGELFMATPRWSHQKVADNICAVLNRWSDETKLGEATTSPGIIFSQADNVIPDVVWVSSQPPRPKEGGACTGSNQPNAWQRKTRLA